MIKFNTTPDDRILKIDELKKVAFEPTLRNTRESILAQAYLRFDAAIRYMANVNALPEQFLTSEIMLLVSADLNKLENNLLKVFGRSPRLTYWRRLWLALWGKVIREV